MTTRPLLSRIKPVPFPSGASTTAVWRPLCNCSDKITVSHKVQGMSGKLSGMTVNSVPASESRVEYVHDAVSVPLKERNNSLLPASPAPFPSVRLHCLLPGKEQKHTGRRARTALKEVALAQLAE